MQARVMSYIFPSLWNLSRALGLETGFTDSNRIKASGHHWSIAGSRRTPTPHRVPASPSLGTALLKWKRDSGGGYQRTRKVKMLLLRRWIVCHFLHGSRRQVYHLHNGPEGCLPISRSGGFRPSRSHHVQLPPVTTDSGARRSLIET